MCHLVLEDAKGSLESRRSFLDISTVRSSVLPTAFSQPFLPKQNPATQPKDSIPSFGSQGSSHNILKAQEVQHLLQHRVSPRAVSARKILVSLFLFQIPKGPSTFCSCRWMAGIPSSISITTCDYSSQHFTSRTQANIQLSRGSP